MFDFVKALHAAFHTDSRVWFVIYMALTFAVAGGTIAYIIDSGYQRALMEAQPSAEEKRLRLENDRLTTELDRRQQRRDARAQLGRFLNEATVLAQACRTQAERPEQQTNIDGWAQRVFEYLYSIDPSYGARFNASNGPTQSFSPGTQRNVSLWNFVNNRIQMINLILQELRD